MKKKNFKNILSENFNIFVLLLFLFFFSSILTAQEIPNVNVLLKIKIKDGDLKNSLITITKTELPYKVINPDKETNGVDLPLGFEYVFTFTKIGYNTKRVLMDTHVPENREREGFANQISEVELDKLSGKLEDNYIQLIGKIKYSMSKGDFDFDKIEAVKVDKTKKNEKISTSTEPTFNQNSSILPVDKQSIKTPEAVSEIEKVKNKEVRIIQEDTRKFTIITITIDSKNYIYKKEEYGWGTFFYKDGKRITSDTYTSETQ
jgi:hypothetical protein